MDKEDIVDYERVGVYGLGMEGGQVRVGGLGAVGGLGGLGGLGDVLRLGCRERCDT